MQLRNVTLEMSLKPFLKTDDDFVRGVCREAFTQWLPLLRDAQQVSVLLWTADGSEILDYRGDMDAPLEWARYIGAANPKWTVPGDPEKKAIHSRPYLYVENPATITYRDLARIVRTLREVGREITGLPVRVGETFDPGTEFARSSFKYERHNEICLANTGGPKSFVCCYGVLKGDNVAYAGFPEGIPDQTPLGMFLGRQCQRMLKDVGFDYLWFSNGFGFGLETWMTRGPLFDGQRFDATEARAIREKILDFWKHFRRECPDFPVETRGTNLTTGIDLASDGVPLREIYRGGYGMMPPPNSPWAALNGDFGLELAGYMSHIAELPATTGFPFRFYTHDPWWHNSPWLDRYGREPHDIYLPMSISRIDGEGKIENPSSILFLTIDDSHGKMPVQVPNEVIPHIQEGMRHAPDRPGPFVWVYPFEEYHDRTFSDDPRLEESFFGDWFIRSAIRNGLPLNTVVSTTNFAKHDPGLYRESILVTPVPDEGSGVGDKIAQFAQAGGKVIFYGPVGRAGEPWLAAMNLRLAEPIAGTLAVKLMHNPDRLGSAYPERLEHRELMSAGGCEATLRDLHDPATHVLATVSKDGAERVAAIVRGNVAWVRGTNAYAYVGGDIISGSGHLPRADDPVKSFHGDLLMRFAADALGWRFGVTKRHSGQENPIMTVARHDNGFFFSGYVPDMTVEMRLRLPQGAPVFVGCDAEIRDNVAHYRMPRAWRRECRLFVEQKQGVVTCAEKTAEMIGLRRRLRVTGLEDATVRFYPPGEHSELTGVLNGSYPYFVGPFVDFQVREDEMGKYLEAKGLTGELVIGW